MKRDITNKIGNIKALDAKHIRIRRWGTILVIGLTIVFNSYAQVETQFIIENADSSNTVDQAEKQPGQVPIDTSVVEVGKKLFIFYELEDGLIIDRINLETGEEKRILDIDGEALEEKYTDTSKFRGHWSGLEYGLNNFLSTSNSFVRPDGARYTSLNSWGSWNLNVNFAQSSTPLIGNHFGIVGGLGIEMNFYSFRNDNSIEVNENTGQLEERVLENEYNHIIKSKFRTVYLTSPLLLETQFGKNKSKDRFYISAGVIGGLRIGSATKFKYREDGNKNKVVKRGDDLNLYRWRWGVTARMGYQDAFNVYATYYFTPIFIDGTGPEMYPVAMGLRINF